MNAFDQLSAHLKTRLSNLKEARKQGQKVIGYLPGGYIPEELILASDAIPVGFIRGGDHSMVEYAGAYICRWIDTFCRAQIGYGISGEDPYYLHIDLLVVPITDNHMRAVMEVLDYNTDIEVFPVGIPHMKEQSAFDYYLHGIQSLKKKIEQITQVPITDERLAEAINLCNEERALFKKISLLRKSSPPIVRSRDFIALHHASFLADKKTMISILDNYYQSIQKEIDTPDGGPRILLTGSTLALGDNNIHDITEKAGGFIVVEEFAEGVRPYWHNVLPDENLMHNLAGCYFMQRVPPAWFRPGGERLEFLAWLAKEFKVDGLLWYHLMYRESYKTESYYFPEILKKETGITTLILESDYDVNEVAGLQTRIETFVENLRR